MAGTVVPNLKVDETINFPHPRYVRKGKCNRCGLCCLQEKCEQLTWDGDIAICKIYENRFPRCKWFPQVPPIPYEGCGYYFLDAWEDNKIVKRRL